MALFARSTSSQSSAIAAEMAPKAAVTRPCSDVTAQLELNFCWEAAAKGAEQALAQRLSKTEGELRAASRDTAIKLLKLSQRTWAAYRDAECRRQREQYQDGSASGMVFAICRWSLATDRIREITPESDS